MFYKISLFAVVITNCAYLIGQCTPTPSQTTFWGLQNVVRIYEHPLKTLRGTVFLGLVLDPPAGEGVLVEVFDHAELALTGDQNRTGQKRLHACLTDKNGRFSIRVPPGKYEVRCSRPPDGNATSMIVEITRGGSSERLSVTLRASQ
jgi:hypothetical protein